MPCTSSTVSTVPTVPTASFAAALSILATGAGHNAVLLVPVAPPIPPIPPRWRSLLDGNAFDQPFNEIRVVCDDTLTLDEITRLSGCLGYALAETVKGEALSEPDIVSIAGPGVRMSVLTYRWPSSECIRTSPDFERAFEVAGVYVVHGSRIRTTNLAGPGTRGTQLVAGIGTGRCNVTFFVR